MIGPNSSGRIAASIMIAQPAWQLPITHGLPSACGCSAMTFSRKTASARAMSSIVWSWHRIGQESDEIARMPGLERDADFAVGLEAADAGTMSGARVDDDERPARWIDLGRPAAERRAQAHS